MCHDIFFLKKDKTIPRKKKEKVRKIKNKNKNKERKIRDLAS